MRRAIGGGHQAPERIRHQHHILEQQTVEELVQRLRIVLRPRLGDRQKIRFAVAWRVPGDQSIPLQRLELQDPAGGGGADAVQADERWTGAGFAVGDASRLPQPETADALIDHGPLFSLQWRGARRSSAAASPGLPPRARSLGAAGAWGGTSARAGWGPAGAGSTGG